MYLTGYVRFTCGHPRGPCRFHRGMGTSTRSRADAMRTWEYPHDQWCRVLRGPVGHASARSGYIYQTKHDYVTFDPLGSGRLLTDAKSLLAQSQSCTCSTFSRGIYGTIKNSSKHRANSECMACDFPRVYTGLALTGFVDCPRASCDLGIKYLMLRSHA